MLRSLQDKHVKLAAIAVPGIIFGSFITAMNISCRKYSAIWDRTDDECKETHNQKLNRLCYVKGIAYGITWPITLPYVSWRYLYYSYYMQPAFLIGSVRWDPRDRWLERAERLYSRDRVMKNEL